MTVSATLLHRQERPPASTADATTIVDLFRTVAARRPEATALRHHDGDDWRSTSWQEYARAVTEVALGWRALGLEPGDRIAILSRNRPEWHIADLAALACGLVTTPVYATSTASQAAHVLRDSGSRACVVEGSEHLAKVLLRRADLPELERVLVLDPVDGTDDGFVIPFADLRALGAAARTGETDADVLASLAAAVEADQLATLVYTSGTTGPPKGAMITHANLMATLRSLTSVVRLGPDDRFLSFLPLSHITERSVSHFGQIASGGETWFSRDLASVPTDLRACRPTLFFAVPRVWEKFRDAVLDQVEHAPPLVRGALRDYLALAVRREGEGHLEPFERARLAALDASAGHLLRHRLGLDRARILTCGAAPVHPGLLHWFHAIGLPVVEGYGQTEVSLCTTLNLPGRTRIGTVGRPIPGVEVRIAPDREILVRGGGVCRGYWGRAEATAELIDADGWLHSGDLGSLDEEGYLRVTGRKKDLIVTAYGKNISPSEIESALEDQPLIAHAVVVGDGRPHLVALLDLDRAEADNWAAAQGFGRALGEDLLANEEIRQRIDAAVEEVNARHAPPERIRRWRLVPRELKISTGDLTPTLKVRRQAVVAANAELVEEMYATTAVP